LQQLLAAPYRQAVDRSVASPHDAERAQKAPVAVLQVLLLPVLLQQEQLALPRFPSPALQEPNLRPRPQRELPPTQPPAFQAQQAPPLPTQLLPPWAPESWVSQPPDSVPRSQPWAGSQRGELLLVASPLRSEEVQP
jgi:hypothetical protein